MKHQFFAGDGRRCGTAAISCKKKIRNPGSKVPEWRVIVDRHSGAQKDGWRPEASRLVLRGDPSHGGIVGDANVEEDLHLLGGITSVEVDEPVPRDVRIRGTRGAEEPISGSAQAEEERRGTVVGDPRPTGVTYDTIRGLPPRAGHLTEVRDIVIGGRGETRRHNEDLQVADGRGNDRVVDGDGAAPDFVARTTPEDGCPLVEPVGLDTEAGVVRVLEGVSSEDVEGLEGRSDNRLCKRIIGIPEAEALSLRYRICPERPDRAKRACCSAVIPSCAANAGS